MDTPLPNVTRTCTKCGRTFPATPEFFFKNSEVNGVVYLKTACKECYREWSKKNFKKWRKKNWKLANKKNLDYYYRNRERILKALREETQKRREGKSSDEPTKS